MRFYKIQIDTIFLSRDGTDAAPYCKLQVTNAEDLLTTVIGQPTPSADGRVVSNLAPWTRGKQFEIEVEVLTGAVFGALKTLINTHLAADSSFDVTGTGDGGNFSETVKPNPVKPFSFQRFLNGRVYGVTLRFITQGS